MRRMAQVCRVGGIRRSRAMVGGEGGGSGRGRGIVAVGAVSLGGLTSPYAMAGGMLLAGVGHDGQGEMERSGIWLDAEDTGISDGRHGNGGRLDKRQRAARHDEKGAVGVKRMREKAAANDWEWGRISGGR